MNPDKYFNMLDEIESVANKYDLQIGVATGSINDLAFNISLEEKDGHHLRCLRCGKKLKSPEAQERGYGKTCWKKHQTDTQTLLF